MRLQRGERVVGDLGTRPGETRDEGALPGVGKADQPHVREQAQLEPDPLSPRPPCPAARNRGACRVGVAKFMFPSPPRPPLRQHPTAVVLAKVRQAPSPLATSRTRVPGGTLRTISGARVPVLVPAAAGLAFLARYSRLKRKSSRVVRRSSVSRTMSPPFPPSPPEGPAARDELLPPEGNGARAAVAGPDGNTSASIDELHGTRRPRCPAGSPGPPRGLSLGLRLGWLDVHVHSIAPALLVLHGAWDQRVEREVATHLHVAAGVHLWCPPAGRGCCPLTTASPPYTLMPRCCPGESRPLREEP